MWARTANIYFEQALGVISSSLLKSNTKSINCGAPKKTNLNPVKASTARSEEQ